MKGIRSALLTDYSSLPVFGPSNHKHGEASKCSESWFGWAVPVLGRHANRGLDRHIRVPVLDNSLYLSGIDLERNRSYLCGQKVCVCEVNYTTRQASKAQSSPLPS